MELFIEMSPEAAAFVREMYENGELDDVVASMVKVEEPVGDAADDVDAADEDDVTDDLVAGMP